MILRKLQLIILLCISAGSLSAQKLWEKPYEKWSQEDVAKILSKSPWVRTYQSTDAATNMQKKNLSDQIDGMRQRDPAPNTANGSTNAIPDSGEGLPVITIRLHSALPVRQALVRLQQIGAGYDKMDEKKRSDFDASMKNILECPLCQKFYIVTMSKSVSSLSQGVENGLFQTMNFDQLKGNVWLVNKRGEKLELAQFIPPKQAKDLAVFFFPRIDGFLTAQDDTFKFVFNNQFFTATNQYAKSLPHDFEFKVSNLLINNKLEF